MYVPGGDGGGGGGSGGGENRRRWVRCRALDREHFVPIDAFWSEIAPKRSSYTANHDSVFGGCCLSVRMTRWGEELREMEKKERERKRGQWQPASSMKKRNTVCDSSLIQSLFFRESSKRQNKLLKTEWSIKPR